ncbi:hypothetical protein [Pseudosulfitobacter sp. DSM 107133]|uniref:hypothetical protein n=1 Tax=Pseudosulfitobacter sp. DSM 107133 TaxID=2883100 RepID=UPI001F07719F|nr:hypothetical protein [Pseudosulfitobacter sp. DSM 107133]
MGAVSPIGTALAQEAPLSVIDWLDRNAPTPAVQTRPITSEPAVAPSGNVPAITVAPLDGPAARRVGLAPASITGLPDTLWTGSDGFELAEAIRATKSIRLPAAQSLFYTLLLAEALPPSVHDEAFNLARVDALLQLGALDPALALLEQIGPESSAAVFARFFDASLLAGTEDAACARVMAKPSLAPGYAARVFCTARAGDWDTAVLLLGTARVLGSMSEAQADMLERFLDPDLFEGEADLPTPAQPDPLAFRVYESIGTPIATTLWPRIYANADLREIAGWRSQLLAVERLAQTGAVADNRLLGIYTDRQPAASGGLWERVRAVQRFETALDSNSAEAVAKTLPAAWREMQAAGLAVHFANLFGDRLPELKDRAATAAAFETTLLSPAYELAATKYPQAAARAPLLVALARGDTSDAQPNGPMEKALADAFAGAPPDATLIGMARTGKLGRALLGALELVNEGSKGDPGALRQGLATLRALGLEDNARRAALQIMLRPAL